MNAHLNDEQMFDLLNEEPAPQSSAASVHLAGCHACRAELAQVRGSLSAFRQATTSYAEVQTPGFALAAPRISSARPWVLSFGRQGWAASAAMAVMLIAVSVTLLYPRYRVASSSPEDGQRMSDQPAPSSPEADAALMDSIQRDLSTSIPPSLEPLALPATNSATSSN